ncbi:MAG TPA: prepilin-type N-terminal cleavage/methylation domain-containing protein [Gemmatimonadales bacterium]|nr:prepilin-type N-terminal cleavage/methylation domain-containing protein [Gemmatimonadales bacterium]
MRVRSRSGFTVAEVLIAVVVLSVGILALAGSAALTSRMVGRGRHATSVGLAAAGRVERLRQVAFSTAPPCSAPEWRSGTASGPGLDESWAMLDLSGPARRVMIVLRSRHATGTSSDTVFTAVLCGTP